MGFLSKAFKGVTKVFKQAVKAPFHFVRDTGRAFKELGQGVGQLAKGDVEGAFKSAVGAVGQATKGASDLATAGGISEDGWAIDTKVKEDSKRVLAAANSSDAAVSFAEAGSPSVVIGADEVEEDVLKRRKQASAGFLGGVASSGSSILIG